MVASKARGCRRAGSGCPQLVVADRQVALPQAIAGVASGQGCGDGQGLAIGVVGGGAPAQGMSRSPILLWLTARLLPFGIARIALDQGGAPGETGLEGLQAAGGSSCARRLSPMRSWLTERSNCQRVLAGSRRASSSAMASPAWKVARRRGRRPGRRGRCRCGCG